MNKRHKLNRISTGIIAGIIFPLIVFVVVYLFINEKESLIEYLKRIVSQNVISHFMSMCVFPNVFIFLIFNRFDKLESSKGMLGITIIWAITVFAINFFS